MAQFREGRLISMAVLEINYVRSQARVKSFLHQCDIQSLDVDLQDVDWLRLEVALNEARNRQSFWLQFFNRRFWVQR